MTTLDVAPPDYAILDSDFLEEEEPTVEIVHWYDRPGWPLGGLAPTAALVGAFALGLAAGAAITVGALVIRDRLND